MSMNGTITREVYTMYVGKQDTNRGVSAWLLTPYPNPAKSVAVIGYKTKSKESVHIEIADMYGNSIREFEGEAGGEDVIWDLRDEAGDSVPDGIYLCRLISEGQISVEKLIVERKQQPPAGA